MAVSIDSPTIKHFRRLAKELDICLVFGFAERIKDDVFNSAVFIDDDGDVDADDILALLADWGPCGPIGPCPADLNEDGVVDVDDILLLLNAWTT